MKRLSAAEEAYIAEIMARNARLYGRVPPAAAPTQRVVGKTPRTVSISKSGRSSRTAPRPRLALATQLIAAGHPSVGCRFSEGTLSFDLEGPIGHTEYGKGVYAEPILAALARHPDTFRIDISINSPGGSLHTAERIYAALRSHPKAVVHTVAEEVCASAATIILAAGDFRQAQRNTIFLFHRGETVDGDRARRWTAERHASHARMLAATDRRLLNIYAERFGSREFFAREIQSETRLPARMARQRRVIHCFVGEERWINGQPYWDEATA